MPSRQGLLITAGVCPLCIAEPSISAMSMLGISMRRGRIDYHRHDESGHEAARNGAFRVCLSHLIFSLLKLSCDNDNSSPPCVPGRFFLIARSKIFRESSFRFQVSRCSRMRCRPR